MRTSSLPIFEALHKKIQQELSDFSETKSTWQFEQKNAEKHLEDIKSQWQVELSKAEKEREEHSRAYTTLSEKKDQIEEQIRYLSQTLEDSKKKVKEENSGFASSCFSIASLFFLFFT